MNEREYQRLKKHIEDDYRKKLDALEVVWALASGLDGPGKAKAEKDDRDEEEGEPRGVLASVEAVLVGVPEIFTTKDVESQFGESNAPERSSISHALKRMTREGKLEIAEAGKGQRPTKYRRVVTTEKAPQPVEMATESDRQEILHLAKATGITPQDFRSQFLDPFGVSRIVELTKEQADSVKEHLEEMVPVGEGSK
ncbi:MAG TPA: hypothetical protein VG826_06250 [Pirellulales bacterium]|nr:hypothetical protein [Pirellulales bacterium]